MTDDPAARDACGAHVHDDAYDAHAYVLRMPVREPSSEASVSAVGDGFLSAAHRDRLPAVLSADERARAVRFRFAADRERYAVAHAYLRLVLAAHLGVDPAAVPLERGPNGEPLVATPPGTPPLRCSLSHAREHVAVAVTTAAPVGIDVEEPRNAEVEEIAWRYFTREEADALIALAPDARHERFLQVWTCKEAFVKAIGLGLHHPLDRFVVRGLGTSAPHYAGVDDAHGPGDAWSLATYALGGGAHAALAVKLARARIASSRTPWDAFAAALERA